MSFVLAFLRELTPPIAWKLLKPLKRKTWGFFGDFPSYEAALAACGGEGYHSEAIAAQTLNDALALRTLCARDRVTCDARTRQVLAAMLIPFAQRRDPAAFRVLDFGGGLGGLYDQVRRFVPEDLAVTWDVVETAPTAKVGAERLETAELRFWSDLAGLAERPYDLVIASSSLQYTPAPEAAFATLGRLDAPFFLLNRLSLFPGTEDRLTVQKVLPRLYHASYPAWFLGEERWSRIFVDGGFNVHMRWQVPEDLLELDGVWRENQGLLLRRN